VPHENVAEVIINAPLDFELKGLYPAHPYLLNRGLTPQTVEYFGLGYCSRGFLKGRIAIPLHDMSGSLIGYAGRIIDESAIDENHPKYLLPGTRRHDGKVYGFRKTLFVYNGHRLKAPLDDLFIVEGFPAVWHLHQNGIHSVVALMGSTCSEEQRALLLSLSKPKGRVWLMPDADEAGTHLAESILLRLAPQRHIRWLIDQSRVQPTDWRAEDLQGIRL
jgi:DNA primase